MTALFLTDFLHFSHRSWDESKILRPCGNHTFPNSVHYHNPESTLPAASCLPGPDDAPHWEMSDFCMGVDSCYNTMAVAVSVEYKDVGYNSYTPYAGVV